MRFARMAESVDALVSNTNDSNVVPVRKKGCGISNVLLFLCTSASIRIPLLLFEISSLGVSFTLIRFGLNLFVIFAIAFITEGLLSDKDRKEIYENANNL